MDNNRPGQEQQPAERISLMVATPAYGCMVHTDYMKACLSLLRGAIQAGIEVDFVTCGNQVTKKARNSLISYFHANKQYTHYIHIDADMGIAADCIPKLLRRNVDIIGVPVPLAGLDEQGMPVLNVGEVYNVTDDGLAEIEHIGNAVLMFSRKAVDAIIEASEPYDDDPRYTKGIPLVSKCYDAFLVGVLDGIYRPEDYSTCYRLRKLGFKIYADLTIPVKHNKMYGFETNPELNKKLLLEQGKQRKDIFASNFSISEEDWKFIEEVIKERMPTRILEFGFGISSMLMSNSAPVVTYETDQIFAERFKRDNSHLGNLKNIEIRMWDGKDIEELGSFDLAFVDGPAGRIHGGRGRENSIRLASENVDNIIIHDAERDEEKRWQDKYLKGKFTLAGFAGMCRWWQRKK